MDNIESTSDREVNGKACKSPVFLHTAESSQATLAAKLIVR